VLNQVSSTYLVMSVVNYVCSNCKIILHSKDGSTFKMNLRNLSSILCKYFFNKIMYKFTTRVNLSDIMSSEHNVNGIQTIVYIVM
jgi:hypothetical protein